MSQNQSGRRDSSRPYRSRKERPCDACRRRKVLCDMPNGVPCIRCIRQRHPCTFDQGPRKRLRSPFQDALPSQQTSERYAFLSQTTPWSMDDADNLSGRGSMSPHHRSVQMRSLRTSLRQSILSRVQTILSSAILSTSRQSITARTRRADQRQTRSRAWLQRKYTLNQQRRGHDNRETEIQMGPQEDLSNPLNLVTKTSGIDPRMMTLVTRPLSSLSRMHSVSTLDQLELPTSIFFADRHSSRIACQQVSLLD